MALEDVLNHRRSASVLVRLVSTAAKDLEGLGSLFDSEAGSRGALLKAGLTRQEGQRKDCPAREMRIFPKLGVAYGAVTQEGLTAMRQHKAVQDVVEANGLRMIRPVPYPSTLAASVRRPDPGPTWGIQALKADALWAEGLSGKDVLVAHLDTGIDGAHPMFDGAIEEAAVFDYTGVQRESKKPPTDSDTHGTHTAGIIVGRTFKKVKAGIAPGAKLLTAEVIDGGDSTARVLGGMEWALARGARVLNLSLGWPTYTNDFLMIIDALRRGDCLPVIAIGNEGEGVSRSPGNYERVLSVGAVDSSHRVPEFSCSETLNREVDPIVPGIVAPGVDIWSAAPGDGFAMMQGTSMATPHISGLAALLLEAYPKVTISQIEKAILDSASRTGRSMPKNRAGRGMPDAPKALKLLKAAVAAS